MVRTFIRLTLSACLLVATQLSSTAQTRMPQLKFTDRTLANGMRVLTVKGREGPTDAVRTAHGPATGSPRARPAD